MKILEQLFTSRLSMVDVIGLAIITPLTVAVHWSYFLAVVPLFIGSALGERYFASKG